MKPRLFFSILFLLFTTCVLAQPVVISPPSATIPPGGSVTLTASGATYYQWSPATGLSTTEGPVTVASPMVTTTYTCSGYAPGTESVVNGNFDQGNVGFTSAYQYNTNLFGEGTYYVDSDASDHHDNFIGHGHGGTGNFMIVNGATSPGINVWTEQITVVPNTYYAFSTWVCTLAGTADQVALLQFSINGNQLGEIFSAPPQLNTWQQFYELWYSETSTSATITILNQNTVVAGNDFGLDDISFCEIELVGAPECTVYVGSMSASATADDTELCEGESTTLHALPTGGSGDYSFSWSPANGLNDVTVQNPVATPPVGTTNYSCHITDNSWGSSQDVSVSIVVHPNEEEHEYETICEGDTYDFYGQVVSTPSLYDHHMQTQYGCDKTIFLHLDNWPVYDETTITEYICDGESYTFYGTSYDHTCQVSYTDQSIHGCDSIVRLNLTVYPPNDSLIIDPSICIGDTYEFHGMLYDQDGQIAYFDTIDNHGCLKVEKLVLSVDEYQMPPVLHQYECYEQGTVPAWTWDKTGITYHDDTYDEIILDDPNGGCPFKYRLDLRFHEEFYQEEWKVACDYYYWPITGETYHESQDRIEKTFHYEFGDQECDSTYVLHLEISDYETSEYSLTPEESCDSYYWDPQGHGYDTDDEYDPIDHVYTQSGVYHRVYRNQMGCDSVVTLNMNFEYTPTPTDICPVDTENASPHWVITATEFQILSYDFHVWDTNPDCLWDTVTWSCDEAPGWILEPYGNKGRYCKLYVLNRVEDTVWLRAYAFNRCAPEYGVEQKYWLVCSFYGVDEQEKNLTDFCVFPNPNNGQMTLNFNHYEGKVNVKVYDMLGNLVDSVEVYNENSISSIQYDMKNKGSGIYFFVVIGKEGVVTKKVIIR